MSYRTSADGKKTSFIVRYDIEKLMQAPDSYVEAKRVRTSIQELANYIAKEEPKKWLAGGAGMAKALSFGVQNMGT